MRKEEKIMKKITPERAGIPSANIRNFLAALEDARLSTHSIILAKGKDIFFEKYYPPFDENFYHRMYSVSKSFVALAIGFLEQDGMLSLDDKIVKYFPEEAADVTDENMKNLTIKEMLTMSTSRNGENWFKLRSNDRVRVYFETESGANRPAGTIFTYDSSASFVLGALAEKLSGKSLTQYLRKKMFDKIGMSEKVHFLLCPGGHSWGDSGLLCTSRDLLKAARFVLDKGTVNGEQILNKKYIIDACSKQVDNNTKGLNEFDTQGYGYQIWKTYHDGFFFNGMGCQLAVCIPEKDIIMIYTGDNQGKDFAKKIIMDKFFELIVEPMEKQPVAENETEYKKLEAYAETLKLAVAIGDTKSEFEDKINGVWYTFEKNPMGITKCRLVFESGNGRLEYTNKQGDKILPFGMCENVFSLFPESGYSDQTGSVLSPGHQYKCAASAAWTEPEKLFIKVQIIDEYFGTLNINIGFNENKMGIYMNKCAEDFLDTYNGYASGRYEK